MKIAYSYYRFSTLAQSADGKKQGTSKTRQTNAAEIWCKENGYTLSTDVFFDKGKSAFKGKHLENGGELKRFLDLVKDGTIKSGSLLCVENFDRLSRLPPFDSFNLFSNIIMAGIHVVFTLSWDKRIITRELLNSPEGNSLLQSVIGECIRAHSESARKSIAVKNGMAIRLKQLKDGEKNKYHRAPKYFEFLNGKYQLTKHAVTVQKMAQMVLDGDSLYGIATKFNAEKIPTLQRDTQWTTTTIRRVLKSKTLIGEQFDRKGFYPLVLDVGTFNRVQGVLNQNSSFNRGKIATFVNMYRGIAFCKCGASMNSINQSKDCNGNLYADPFKYRYFRCTTKSTGKKCQYEGNIRLTDLEQQFFGDFLLQNPNALVADKSETKALHGKINVCKMEITKLESEVSKLVAMSHKYKLSQLDAELDKLNSQLDAKKLELDAFNSNLGNIELAPTHFDDVKKLLAEFEFEPGKWNSDENFVLSKKALAYDAAIKRITEALKNNELRGKLKTILPTLIGKMIVDTTTKTFEVFNHSGKCVYQSEQY